MTESVICNTQPFLVINGLASALELCHAKDTGAIEVIRIVVCNSFFKSHGKENKLRVQVVNIKVYGKENFCVNLPTSA